MKIERTPVEPVFEPIVITIQNVQELLAIRFALSVGIDKMGAGLDKSIARDLKNELYEY